MNKLIKSTTLSFFFSLRWGNLKECVPVTWLISLIQERVFRSPLLSSLLNSGNLKVTWVWLKSNQTNEGNCYLLSWFFFPPQRQLWFMAAASPVYATIVRGLDCCFHIRNVFRWKHCHSFCTSWWSCYVYLSAVSHLHRRTGWFSSGYAGLVMEVLEPHKSQNFWSEEGIKTATVWLLFCRKKEKGF